MNAYRHRQGFTLLEMGIVLLVLSIMAAGVLGAITQNNRIAKQKALLQKMDAIEEALLAFRKQNNRIPCPSDGSLAVTSANFGVEGATAGTCTGGTPAANFTDGSNTVGGVVPVRTLGLPDETMFDPWGGRFMYIADKRATGSGVLVSTGTGTYYPVSDTTIGSITVNDSTAAARTAKALAALISYGPDGHGAYQISGTRKSSGITNTHTQKNCHCDSAGAATAFDATFYQENYSTSSTDMRDTIDDTLRFYTRGNLISSSDLLTEKY